ncbi:MAG: HAD family hydrolase [Planctomycetota bacterium]
MTDFAFDAVLFDLDGTLVATERYWPDAARTATLRFFAERGIERAVPSTAEWMAMVGLPAAESFDRAFADLEPTVRAELLDACMDEEHRLLARGHAALLGGVEETLDDLKGRGVKLGIASNCGADYLELMLRDVGLSRWIDEGRCLASRGIASKSDMVEDLLVTFGTRSAVMVGDRRGDRDAAWANALPHVHIPRGYGGAHEPVEAEAILDGMDQLVPTLEGRDAVLRDVLDRVGDARIVAVSGPPLAGKTLLARDLARLARAAGRRADAVEGTPDAIAAADDALEVLFVAGEALERDALASYCDAFVRVIADEEALVRRAQGQRRGPGPVEELLDVQLPRYRENAGADRDALVVDATNPIDLRLR